MEQPTIFYPAVIILAMMGADGIDVLLAWIYVGVADRPFDLAGDRSTQVDGAVPAVPGVDPRADLRWPCARSWRTLFDDPGLI